MQVLVKKQGNLICAIENGKLSSECSGPREEEDLEVEDLSLLNLFLLLVLPESGLVQDLLPVPLSRAVLDIGSVEIFAQDVGFVGKNILFLVSSSSCLYCLPCTPHRSL